MRAVQLVVEAAPEELSLKRDIFLRVADAAPEVLAAAAMLQRLKRNRPEGYYLLKTRLWLHDHGLKRAPFVRRSGLWDLGRRNEPLPFRD